MKMSPRESEIEPKPDHDENVSGIGKITRKIVSTSKEAILSDNIKKLFYNLLTALLTVSLILSVSVFTYGAFYFAYMPSEVLNTTSISEHHCLLGS